MNFEIRWDIPKRHVSLSSFTRIFRRRRDNRVLAHPCLFSGLTVGISDAKFNRPQPHPSPRRRRSGSAVLALNYREAQTPQRRRVAHIARIRDYHRVILISPFVRAFMTAYQRTPRELDSASTGYKVLSRGWSSVIVNGKANWEVRSLRSLFLPSHPPLSPSLIPSGK